MPDRKDENKKRGNRAGFLFFQSLLKIVGLKHSRRIASIVCFYYLLFDRDAVKKAMPYVRHILPDAGYFKRIKFTYLIFVNQANMLLDRVAFNIGLIKFDPISEGYDTFEAIATKKVSGVILLGAHFGNWQLAVEGLKKVNSKINIVMSPETNQAVKRYLKINNASDNISYIFTDGPDHGALEITSALCAGEVVCLMGDRAYGADTVEVEFLKDAAYFPYSAWVIAAKTKSAVISFFVSKKKTIGYYVSGSKPVYPIIENRKQIKESVMPYVEGYIRFFENIIKDYPEQCFLFKDVWKK